MRAGFAGACINGSDYMAVTTKFELKLGPATREAFGKALVDLGRENPNVVALDADLSKSTYTAGFAKEFPDRFFECGIAEANMVAIGSGLAASGKIPFASSLASMGSRFARKRSGFIADRGYPCHNPS